MPVRFTPDLIPRYDATFLRYINENFQKLKQALLQVPVESIGTAFPASPYVGQEFYNSTDDVWYWWDGVKWREGAQSALNTITLTTGGGVTATGVLGVLGWNVGSLPAAWFTYLAGVFTVVKEGVWQVNYQCTYNPAAGGAQRAALINVNGAFPKRDSAPPNAVFGPGANVVHTQRFVVGDTFSAYYYQDSGGGLAIAVADTNLTLTRLGN